MIEAVILLSILGNALIYAKVLNVDIKAHDPRGISICIPDEPGIEGVYFWANINVEFGSTIKGIIRLGTVQPIDGRWMIRDDDLELKSGDVINYVLFIKRNSVIERYENRKFLVPGLEKSPDKQTNVSLSPAESVTNATQGVNPSTKASNVYTTPSTNVSVLTATAATPSSTTITESSSISTSTIKSTSPPNSTTTRISTRVPYETGVLQSSTSNITTFFSIQSGTSLNTTSSSTMVTTTSVALTNATHVESTTSNIIPSSTGVTYSSISDSKYFSSISSFNHTVITITNPSSTTTNLTAVLETQTLGPSTKTFSVYTTPSANVSVATTTAATPNITSTLDEISKLATTVSTSTIKSIPQPKSTTSKTSTTASYGTGVQQLTAGNITISSLMPTNVLLNATSSSSVATTTNGAITNVTQIESTTSNIFATSAGVNYSSISSSRYLNSTTSTTTSLSSTTGNPTASPKNDLIPTRPPSGVIASTSNIEPTSTTRPTPLTTSTTLAISTVFSTTPSSTVTNLGSTESRNFISTSSTSVPLSTAEFEIVKEKPYSQLGDDCSHRIFLKTDDFTLDFYGNVDMSNINPKMLASLAVNDCDVKYEVAEKVEPDVVDFYIS